MIGLHASENLVADDRNSTGPMIAPQYQQQSAHGAILICRNRICGTVRRALRAPSCRPVDGPLPVFNGYPGAGWDEDDIVAAEAMFENPCGGASSPPRDATEHCKAKIPPNFHVYMT